MSGLRFFAIIFAAICLASCSNEGYTPKPTGFPRISFPQKQYIAYNKTPYTFEYPSYGIIRPDTASGAEPHWINIEFPEFKGKIHLSYKKPGHNLAKLIEDCRRLAYKHSIKADAIDELPIKDDRAHVYGVLYDIKGNTASSVQFFVTDSTKHFLRGALYFTAKPNKDSLAPVIDFFRKDIDHLITGLAWK